VSNATLAVKELVRLAEHVAEAVEQLGAYDRGDRRAALAAWDALWSAVEPLEAARDYVRSLRVE
jgi:hypothetical protein